MASVILGLNRYFALIERRVPTKVGTFIRWLREPSKFWIRVIVAGILILGGIFSFLPLFGLWMLPLGLLLIAQDMPILQKPLLVVLRWIEMKWKRLRRRFRTRRRPIVAKQPE
ncbi:hypothetical protein [Bradyrhizobium japonicum]|uniref:hypothetical protein n=1 Tax=Bradyrhizobium japonicum TaxID=375 RepID=UPI002714A217|nr:hypothetical protein [Bradyrhizobium japonicum]WLB54811.1 hypothetical protein QIH94_02125 [Bradyrhizobium japonicum]WLB63314.1 hypothetical protein QIH96_43760 [Bradyrhizobium japonicum]